MASGITTKIKFSEGAVTARLAIANKRAQMWLDNEVLKDCTPYVPRLTGMLEHSGIDGTKVGSGEIIWNSPYARYQYYGKVMIGKAPKTVTDISLKYSKQSHNNAGRLWFERAKAKNKSKWIRGVKKIGGGG